MHSIRFLALTVITIGMLGTSSTTFGAHTYLVTVDTSSLSGESGWMEMQFNPGGLPLVTGSAAVSNFSTNATLNPASIQLTGDCTGDVSPPTSLVQFNNSTGLNDYFESLVFGTTLSFHVTLDGDVFSPPNGTLYGSSFFLGFFDDAITQSLLGDPGDGSAARIDVLFDGTVNLLPGTSATSIVSVVPEPASLGLLAAGAMMMLTSTRSFRGRPRNQTRR